MNPFVKFEKGARVGKLELDSVIGRGRSAIVLRARDTSSGGWVALKVLDPFLAQDAVSVERFHREVLALSSLQHPNIISVGSVFQWEDSHCIEMEHFEGENLRLHLNQVGRLRLPDFFSLAEQLLGALEACHQARILHRDLKPQNVLVSRNGKLKLVDFGISKINSMSDLTKTGTFLGTPEYMAPEMFTSTLSDGRVDVYGLGALFFEMLAGKSPYFGLSIQHVMTKQMAGAIPSLRESNPEVPAWLECIIRKCLQTKPEHRYASIYELRTDLAKGEKALAVIEGERERVHCWECQGELLPGFPFCHLCGMLLSSVQEPGPCAIIVNRMDETTILATHAERQLSLTLASDWERGIRKRPFVLVRGLSEKAAKVFYNSLGALPLEAQVASNLSHEMKLPLGIVLLEALFMAPVIAEQVGSTVLFGSNLFLTLYLIGSQLPILWFFRRQSRPVAALRPRQANSSSAESIYQDWHQRLMKIESRRIRHLLATQLMTFANIHLELEAADRPDAATERSAIAEALESAMHSAETLSKWEAFLGGTSLNDIKEREREIGTKLRLARPDQTESLIRAQAEVKQEFDNYRLIQTKYHELYLSLICFHTLLKRVEQEKASYLALREETELELAEPMKIAA
jgi:hypothetical protein